ncbi:MAG: hypothetical protein EOM70_10695 [Clostridia bacterium]|nr:hypothetical protein [Clostridia bacterium]
MRGWRHWIKREVIIPAGMLILSSAALAWLGVQLLPLLAQPSFRWLLYVFLASLFVFALFAYVTLRHILSTYTLERFDPGNPDSVKRLARMTRFNYPVSGLEPQQLGSALLESLRSAGFSVEANHTVLGTVLIRSHPPLIPLFGRPRHDRVFLLEKSPLNVFIVDFTIRDAQRYLLAQASQPADCNVLVLLTQEPQLLEAASAAAGVVNFLGRTEDGMMGALLFDCVGHRLYYPIDQTLLPWHLRQYFRRLRHQLAATVTRER